MHATARQRGSPVEATRSRHGDSQLILPEALAQFQQDSGSEITIEIRYSNPASLRCSSPRSVSS